MTSSLRFFIPKEEITYKDLIGKTIAVDYFNSLYQFLAAIRDQNGNILERNGTVVSHLYGILWRYGYLLSIGVKIIFVFDGHPSSLKNETILKRNETKKESLKLEQEAKENKDFEKAKMYAKRNINLTDEIIESSKKLATLLGIDYIVSPEEGETQCVYLQNKGIADYVVTQDYDAILYNCNAILRNLGVRSNGKYINPTIISTSKVLKSMGISITQFLYVAFMTGTDYNDGIYNVGIKRALKIAKEVTRDDELIQKLIDYGYVSADEKEKYQNELTNVLYKLRNPNVEKDTSKIIKGRFDEVKLKEFLSNLNFNIQRFEPMIQKIKNQLSKSYGVQDSSSFSMIDS